MEANKTAPTAVNVDEFIDSIDDEQKRKDAIELRELMERATGEPATMWGPTMIGFGSYHYKYASGREGDTFLIGFSPRKPALTLYGLHNAYDPASVASLDRLGKHTIGKSCLYIKRLSDIDRDVLAELITEAVRNPVSLEGY